jgi:basic membrane lipoprotein Med (substrate-binding protein (PBP1-ABC) superfamily)
VKIYKKGVIAIVACSVCACVQVLYVFSLSSLKCAKCTYKGVLCDRSFSKADYNKLSKKKARLETAR